MKTKPIIMSALAACTLFFTSCTNKPEESVLNSTQNNALAPPPYQTSVFVGAQHGYLDGAGNINSLFRNPKGVDGVFDYGVVIADCGNNMVRLLHTATKKVITMVGNQNQSTNTDGSGNKFTSSGLFLQGTATINKPTGICAGPSLKVGNAVNFYVLDSDGHIRRISYTGGTGISTDLKFGTVNPNISFQVSTLPNIQIRNATDICCDWQNAKLYVVSDDGTRSLIQQISLNTATGTATLNTQPFTFASSTTNHIRLNGLYFDNVQRTGLYVAGVDQLNSQGSIFNAQAPASWNIQTIGTNINLYYGDDIVADPFSVHSKTKLASVLVSRNVFATLMPQYYYFDYNGFVSVKYSNSYAEDKPQYLCLLPASSTAVNVFSSVYGAKSTITANPNMTP